LTAEGGGSIIRHVRRIRVGLPLGHLEHQVLEEVWRRGEATVREMRASLAEPLAYTTVMTTLDRLYRKGILQRRREGRAFVYAASAPREEFERSVVTDLFSSLLSSDLLSAQPLLSSLVEAVVGRDRLLLNELEELVREKRRELQRKDR
jgi:predicted transcriptional regulator